MCAFGGSNGGARPTRAEARGAVAEAERPVGPILAGGVGLDDPLVRSWPADA